MRTVNKQELISNWLDEHHFISSADTLALGISRRYLYKMCALNQIKRVSPGLFTSAKSANFTERDAILEVYRQLPECTVSLLSALQIYELTTQLPSDVWVTVPRGQWKPKIAYPPVHYTVVGKEIYKIGVQEQTIGVSKIKIYTPARTVVDCFRFRAQIGLDIALEALRETWRTQKSTMDELTEIARALRMQKVMEPYLEAII